MHSGLCEFQKKYVLSLRVILNIPYLKVLRVLLPILAVLCLLCWSSCRKDFVYRESEGRLEFSKDTVFLDTVFTNISSSTYSFKVYNRTGDDIIIPTVGLAQGSFSSYRLNVEGEAGQVFNDVTIMARDSLYIFIETTFDISQINQNEFLYTDVIQFMSSSSIQEVPLVTLIKDAVFLFPSEQSDGSTETIVIGIDDEGNEIRVEGFVLTDEQLTFTSEKPYVIYGYAAVADNRTLTVNPGARIHFHKDSGLLVGEGASLKVNGELSTDQELLENEVVFEGDRLEPGFAEVPGQWGTIWLSPGSLDHDINYCTIKNATVGLLVEGRMAMEPTLEISNSQIYNSATVNLWGINTSMSGTNLILGSAGEASLFCDTGGDYRFIHTTIANYWSDSFRTGTAVQLTNFGSDGAADLENALFQNSIIFGNTARELSLRSNDSNVFNFKLEDCLLKFNDPNGQFEGDPLYDFEDQTYYSNVYLNEDPDFLNTARSDFRLGTNSFAISRANPDFAMLVPLDILGIDRTTEPDLGAYEFEPEE